MDTHDRPVIEYEAYQPRRRRRPSFASWVVPIVSGSSAGWILSFSGDGWLGFGMIVGFVVALLSAAVAPGRRVSFGLLGNGCTILVWFLSVTFNNWRSGYLMALSELPLIGLFLGGVVIVPGLFGIAIVCKIDSTTRLDA